MSPSCISRHWFPKFIVGIGAFLALLRVPGVAGATESPGVEGREVLLPPLVRAGRPMRAHTQGLVWAAGRWWVTARREDATPRSALLLAWTPGAATWEHWDLSADPAVGLGSDLNHAGGLQADGSRLWIPVAESRRHGRSVVASFDIQSLTSGASPISATRFSVSDHVGAIAVIHPTLRDAARDEGILLGASWDTETVYGWSKDGTRRFAWNTNALQSRGLGPGTAGEKTAGVAVQDWKWHEGRLFASGLSLARSGTNTAPFGRLLIYSDILDPAAPVEIRVVPLWRQLELAREAMCPDLDGQGIWFLPADLGRTNRIVRVELSSLRRIPSPHP